MSETIVLERSVLARIGLWLWSFLAPGVILLRVGAPRMAIAIFIAYLFIMTLFPFTVFSLSGASFLKMILILGGFLTASVFVYGLCLWAVLKFGKIRPLDPKW